MSSVGAYGTIGLSAIKAAAQFERTVSGVTILSQPVVWVDVGEDAVLNAGDSVPILDRTTTTDSKTTQSVTYRDVGVVLKVKPESRRGNVLRLKVTQEVSDATKTTTSAIDSPTISKRSVDTTISAVSGQTVVMGGMVRRSDSDHRSGTPWLEDLPVVGSVFSSRSAAATRTELVLLVTPTVINDTSVTAVVQRSIDRIMSVR